MEQGMGPPNTREIGPKQLAEWWLVFQTSYFPKNELCESVNPNVFLTLLFRMTWKLPVPGLPIASHKSTVEPSQYLEGQHHGGCPGRARTQTHRVVGAHLQV